MSFLDEPEETPSPPPPRRPPPPPGGPSTDPQTLLLGKLNKIYGVAGANAPPPNYRGSVGFIHD